MAKNLNKTRLRDTRILMLLVLFTGIFAASAYPDNTISHEAFEMAGYVLVTICAIGRVYSSAFIGGVKNKDLITAGPYSICRNPLYLFSLLGAAGIGLMTTQLVALAVIFGGFLLIYLQLIAREEAHLQEIFGAAYTKYKKRVPKLIPSFKNYSAPEEMVFQPRYLTKSVFDAIWWFVPYILFEIGDMLEAAGFLRQSLFVF